MTHSLRISRIIVASALAFGCSGNDNKNDQVTPEPPIDWTLGRGTAACREWQRAFCQALGKCGATSLATCAAQMQEIACNSDTTATNCATAYDSATCNTLTTVGCNVADLVDTAPAIQGCNTIYGGEQSS